MVSWSTSKGVVQGSAILSISDRVPILDSPDTREPLSSRQCRSWPSILRTEMEVL